jgi:hypothetical protein
VLFWGEVDVGVQEGSAALAGEGSAPSAVVEAVDSAEGARPADGEGALIGPAL